MRVYLDTNILAFLVGQDRGNSISEDVRGIVEDYETLLLTSSICIMELIHLIQIGKVHIPGYKDIRRAGHEALKGLNELGVGMVPFSENHVRTLIDLPLYDDHHDPNDRMIIAQAMSDRIPLVSSDRKFTRYERYGLDFIVKSK